MMNIAKKTLLGLQHTLAMFGSTVLVPFLTGLNVSITLLCVGLGTLVFHCFTKFRVPVFLGSSFAFIGAISLTLKSYGLSYVKGGIIIASIVYIAVALLVYIFGKSIIIKAFPAIVTGPIIMTIGLRLSPVALHMSGYSNGHTDSKNLMLALVAIITALAVIFITKSFFRHTPIVLSVIIGYAVAIMTHQASLLPVINAPWISFIDSSITNSIFTIPRFNLESILAIAPIALVTTMEHIGDIKTNGEVVGKDFFTNPGLHRTLSGDGVATLLSGLLGGPAVTTYGENTGVLAITKIYDTSLLRIAAFFAIAIACIGKISALITNIPVPVMGGISIILFGMITAIGIRTILSANLNFSYSRNLIIPALILVPGIGINDIAIHNIHISGLFIATILGIFLNLILPKKV